ncbi:hypothetical protein EXIGLDRAFT_841191 [Exidia glandulosa HHB12029]|uniref:Uncharacterized protein n=1 Tax=Exidia glandulosa HHB12029 TaxID=1314781 RepID=A0A165E154_EXIGL|nr:hypothetical protein EXIGLDRAFT_841191 [Exidia glandulosa HHB12029]
MGFDKRAFVKISYAVHPSQSYSLALTRRVPATILPPLPGHEHALGYAKIPLKHCLHTLCANMPELVADGGKDYTVYALDPLEPEHDALALPAHIAGPSTVTGVQMSGPAIGMGLMSWCLSEDFDDDDAPFVVGPLFNHPAMDTAVSIVLTLRETETRTRAQHEDLMKLWGKPVYSPSAPPPASDDEPFWAIEKVAPGKNKSATSSPALAFMKPTLPQLSRLADTKPKLPSSSSASGTKPKPKPSTAKPSQPSTPFHFPYGTQPQGPPHQPPEYFMALALAEEFRDADPELVKAFQTATLRAAQRATNMRQAAEQAPPSSPLMSHSSRPMIPSGAAHYATPSQYIGPPPKPMFNYSAPTPVENVQYTLPRPKLAVSVGGLGPGPKSSSPAVPVLVLGHTTKENVPPAPPAPAPRGVKRPAETQGGGPKKKPSPRGAGAGANVTKPAAPTFARPATPRGRETLGMPMPSSSPLFSNSRKITNASSSSRGSSATPRRPFGLPLSMTSSPPRMSSPTPAARRQAPYNAADLPPSSPLPPTSDAEEDLSSATTTPTSISEEEEAEMAADPDADNDDIDDMYLHDEIFGELEDAMAIAT